MTAAAVPAVFAKTDEATPGALTAEVAETAASDYVLPYPGILPDHPLYALKRFRDYILDRLIVDPVRKAEFHILQADKRLNMGLFLLERGNAKLAEETVSKGEKYMHRAVYELVAYKSSGKTVPAYITEKLGKSMEKHKQVLTEIAGTAGETEKSGFAGSLELVLSLEPEAAKLIE